MSDSRASGRYVLRTPWTIIGMVVAAGLALAWGWGNQRAAITDATMRENLRGQVTDLARTLNPGLAKKLTFTATDQGTPVDAALGEQLLACGARIPNRGIFTTAQHDGKIFFGPETYPPGDPVASSPGAVYEEPPFGEKRGDAASVSVLEPGAWLSAGVKPTLAKLQGETNPRKAA